MKQSLSELVPVELKDFTLIREWQVAGPFDLGRAKPLEYSKQLGLGFRAESITVIAYPETNRAIGQRRCPVRIR